MLDAVKDLPGENPDEEIPSSADVSRHGNDANEDGRPGHQGTHQNVPSKPLLLIKSVLLCIKIGTFIGGGNEVSISAGRV